MSGKKSSHSIPGLKDRAVALIMAMETQQWQPTEPLKWTLWQLSRALDVEQE
jgi:hypothetical protein